MHGQATSSIGSPIARRLPVEDRPQPVLADDDVARSGCRCARRSASPARRARCAPASGSPYANVGDGSSSASMLTSIRSSAAAIGASSGGRTSAAGALVGVDAVQVRDRVAELRRDALADAVGLRRAAADAAATVSPSTAVLMKNGPPSTDSSVQTWWTCGTGTPASSASVRMPASSRTSRICTATCGIHRQREPLRAGRRHRLEQRVDAPRAGRRQLQPAHLDRLALLRGQPRGELRREIAASVAVPRVVTRLHDRQVVTDELHQRRPDLRRPCRVVGETGAQLLREPRAQLEQVGRPSSPSSRCSTSTSRAAAAGPRRSSRSTMPTRLAATRAWCCAGPDSAGTRSRSSTSATVARSSSALGRGCTGRVLQRVGASVSRVTTRPSARSAS